MLENNTIVMLNDILEVSFSFIGICFENWLYTNPRNFLVLLEELVF